MKKTVAFRKEKKNKSMFIITFLVMLALAAVVFIGGRPKVEEKERLEAEIATLQTQLAEEEERTQSFNNTAQQRTVGKAGKKG